MKLNEFFDHLDVTEASKKFPEGHYTHTPGALEVMPTQDQTMWADAGELPKKFNVTKMKIAIYDEQDDEDPYSYGNGGLLVYHNAGTWKMYTDDVTRVQIADYLGIPTKDIDFSEQGMQSEEYMHFDIEDDTVSELISKGTFKLEENTTEDDMSTGTVAYGKKGKTRRATGIDDNPYDHNEGEDHPALVNAALWNMKDIYQTIMAGEEVSEEDMFSYGDVLQYLDMSGIPGYDFYEDFIDTVSTAVSQAQPGGFAGQGDAVLVDKKFASKIKTLYQQFKAATAKVKGVKEGARSFVDKESGKRIYIPDAEIPIPRLLRVEWQPDVSRALRKAAGLPDSAYVYFDDADLVYGSKTVWPMCGVDDKCTFGDAVKALKKFAKANPFDGERHFKEDNPTSTKLNSEEIKQKALLYMMRQHEYQKDRRQYDADNSGDADKFYTEQDIENLEAMIAHLKDGASLDPALQDELAKVLRDAKVKDRTGRFAMRKMDLEKKYQDQLRKYKPLEMGEDINDIIRLSGLK